MEVIESVVGGMIGGATSGGTVEIGKGVMTGVQSIAQNKKTVDDGLREYSKRESINEKLLGFVDSISKMKDKMKISKRKQSLGSISPQHSNLLSSLINNETGKTVDFSDFELWIDGSAVEHIETRHGKNGEADHSMSNPEDIARIPWAVNNADRASFARNKGGSIRYNQTFRNSDGTLAPVILVEKSIGNDNFIVAECAPDTKAKKINVISAYIQKNSSSNQVMNIEPDGSPHPTPETPLDSTATVKSISENGENVNSTDEENEKLFVSGTGENVLTSTGEAVETGEIVGFTADGMPVFEIEGKRVSAHEIEFKDDQTANIYASTEGMSVRAANEMIALSQMLPEGSDVETFIDDFKYAYEIGLAGEDTTSLHWQRANFKIDSDVASLARSMGEADLNARRKAQKEKNKRAATEKSGKRGAIDKSGLLPGTKIPFAADHVSRVLSEAGFNIRFIEDDGSDSCGSYNADTNTITINVANVRDRSGVRILMGETLSHEITHAIQKWNLDGYEELKGFIRRKLGEERFLQRVGEIMEEQNLPYGKAVDEVVAEGCERMLENSKALSEFAKEHKSIFEKIKENVEKFLSKIRDAIKALYGNESADVRSVAHELEAYADEMQEIFDRVLKKTLEASAATVDRSVQSNANQKAPAQVGEVQYKIKYPTYTKSDIDENIQTVANMSSVYDVPASKLERTGKKATDIYKEFFDDWGNNIYSEEFGDIAVKNSSAKSEVRHGITAEKIASIEAIPTVINEGKVIFSNPKDNSDVYRIVVAAPIKIGNTPYVMGVMLQRDSQNQRLYLHNVVIEKEMTDFSEANLLTSGADENYDHLFITNILQKVLDVKHGNQISSDQHRRKRNTLVETLRKDAKTEYKKEILDRYKDRENMKDAEGRKLSEVQRSYFAESVVRDNKGRLIPVYHGTKNAGFTVFSKSDDIGYFFARSLRTTTTYSGTKKIYAPDRNSPEFSGAANYKVYLNITKPLIIEGKGTYWNNLESIGDKVTLDVICKSTGTDGSCNVTIKMDVNGKTQKQTFKTTDDVYNFFLNTFDDKIARAMGLYMDGMCTESKNGKFSYSCQFPWDFERGKKGYSKNTRDIVRRAYNSTAGYDGVIFKDVIDGSEGQTVPMDDLYVIFESEQAKSVNNTEPTGNKDIRYKRKRNTLVEAREKALKKSRVSTEAADTSPL